MVQAPFVLQNNTVNLLTIISSKNNMFYNNSLKNLLTTVFILLGSILMPAICKGQYIGHFTLKDRIKTDTLIDKPTGVRFILDKKRITIKAIDRSGKVLWKTNPSFDNKLPEYRVKRPTIVYFVFGVDRTKKEAIAISYSNTQFGFLDKKTGKFKFEGQD